MPDDVTWELYDWEYTDPKTGKWSYARTPHNAQKLADQGIKLTPVYVPSRPIERLRTIEEMARLAQQ